MSHSTAPSKSLNSPGSRAGQSNPLTFKVKRSLVLARPIIRLAPGDVLDPEKVLPAGLPVNVAVYGGMTPGDKVKVVFAGVSTDEQTVSAVAELTFTVSKAQVDAHADSRIKVHYEVVPVSGGPAVPSPELDLQIDPLAPALSIDPTPVSLTGVIHRNSAPVPNPPANSFVTRTASGGRPPYTYSTSNANVIEVDATSGRAVSYGSGSASVTVTDANHATASYPVTVSGVRMFEGLGSFNVWYWCRDRATERGGSLPTLAEWNALRANYNGTHMETGQAWSLDSAGTGKRWAITPSTGATAALRATSIGGDTAIGWGIFNR